MRCICCNVVLTPYESSFKNSSTGDYMDMCTKCFSFVRDDIDVTVNRELEHEDGTDVANYIDSNEDSWYDNNNNSKNSNEDYDDEERVLYE